MSRFRALSQHSTSVTFVQDYQINFSHFATKRCKTNEIEFRLCGAVRVQFPLRQWRLIKNPVSASDTI